MNSQGEELEVDTALVSRFVTEQENRVKRWLVRQNEGPSVYEIRDQLGEIMMGKVGIFRNGDELEQAVSEIRDLIAAFEKAVLRSHAPGMNPELTFALRLRGMLQLALISAMGASSRTESRGAHSRTDYPARDDENWLNRTLAHWRVGADGPEFSYEPVGIIDLPPAGRGYGKSSIHEMSQDLATYNESVSREQTQHGRLDSTDVFGSRLRRGEWRNASVLRSNEPPQAPTHNE